MKVFLHHIYEYKKGLRNLILHTTEKKHEIFIINKLSQYRLAYLITEVNEQKINVFFGNPSCIKILENFGNKPLHKFTDEEDFILGIMLGYCRRIQCERYLKKKQKKHISISPKIA